MDVCLPAPGWNANYLFYFFFFFLDAASGHLVICVRGDGFGFMRVALRAEIYVRICEKKVSAKAVSQKGLCFWVGDDVPLHWSPLLSTWAHAHTHTCIHTLFHCLCNNGLCAKFITVWEVSHGGFYNKGFSWSQARDDAVMRCGSCFQTASGHRSLAVCIVFSVDMTTTVLLRVSTGDRRRVPTVHMSVLGCLLLHLEFLMVKLFQLAAAARCVTMATTETTERETMQEQHRATIFATVANSKA